MHIIRYCCAVTFVLLLAVVSAVADGNGILAYVPASAKGYVYYDNDLFRRSNLFRKISSDVRYAKAVDTLKNSLGVGSAEITDVSFILFSDQRSDILLLVRGGFMGRSPGKLGNNFSQIKSSRYTIYSFLFDKRLTYLAYPRRGMMVLGNKLENIQEFLDALDSKSPSVEVAKMDWKTPVTGKFGFLYMAPQLFENSEFIPLRHVKEAVVEISEKASDINIHFDLLWSSEDVAKMMQGLCAGIPQWTDGSVTISGAGVSVNASRLSGDAVVSVDEAASNILENLK